VSSHNKAKKNEVREEPVTWESLEHAQLFDSAFKVTPGQRLAWLEDALQFAFKSGAIKSSDR